MNCKIFWHPNLYAIHKRHSNYKLKQGTNYRVWQTQFRHNDTL